MFARVTLFKIIPLTQTVPRGGELGMGKERPKGGNSHQRAMAATAQNGRGLTLSSSSPVPEPSGTPPKPVREPSNKPIFVELGIEFLVELLLFFYPYGAEQMNLPHNFWLGFGCWVFATAIAVRMFWIFPTRLTHLKKGLIAFLCVGVFAWAVHEPVIEAYKQKGQKQDGQQQQAGTGTTAGDASSGAKQTSAEVKPSPPPGNHPVSVGEIKDANALANKLLNEYAGNHCPINADEAVAWVNSQLQSRETNFQIFGLSIPPPDKQTCVPLAVMKFGHVKGLHIEGNTILNPSNLGVVVQDSPGASVNGNAVVYGNNAHVHVTPPQSAEKQNGSVPAPFGREQVVECPAGMGRYFLNKGSSIQDNGGCGISSTTAVCVVIEDHSFIQRNSGGGVCIAAPQGKISDHAQPQARGCSDITLSDAAITNFGGGAIASQGNTCMIGIMSKGGTGRASLNPSLKPQ
jgi:hypothetical protein